MMLSSRDKCGAVVRMLDWAQESYPFSAMKLIVVILGQSLSFSFTYFAGWLKG